MIIPELSPLWLSLELASITTIILLLLGTPLALWLSKTRFRAKAVIEAIICLPLVLPPTVLGLYLLILLGAHGYLGEIWIKLTGHTLVFTFLGLVIGSVVYSVPFVVQPLKNAFDSISVSTLELSSSLGASPIDRFCSVQLPLIKKSFLTAGILAFTHTLGEFGVVLMIGGNIPGKTKVASVAIYDHVELMQYQRADILSLVLIGFSIIVLTILYKTNKKSLNVVGL